MFIHIKNIALSVLIILSIINPFIIACSQSDYKKNREKMVQYQIVNRGIQDSRVISAMQNVERHLFVPTSLANQAYNDSPLPIGYNQTISQPYIVAYMTEILDLKKTDRVLEIGTGSGYQAAILGEICDSVFTIEVIPELGEQAKNLLTILQYKNIEVKIGDGYKGWKEHAPFDAIIVTCAPTHIPEPLKEQLNEGGKMIIPVGERYVQELLLLKKIDGEIIQKKVFPVRFVPMVDPKGKLY